MHSSAASVRKPALGVAAFVLGALAIVLLLVYGPGPHRAQASSHAEAPLIGQDPRADNTDLYAFVSPENTNTVTMIANYIPLEAPASGPNFYSFDDTVLYEIKIDNDGDGAEDIGYQFRFTTTTRNPNTFLYNTGPITSLERPELEPAADLQRHARPLQEGRQGREGRQEQAGRARHEHPDAARQHRAALDAELRRARGRRGHEPAGRDQGLRRPARRSVLRRPRLDLRPRRAASVQSVPPDPARPRTPGVDALEELQHALDRDPGADRRSSSRSRTTTIGIYASASRQKERVLSNDGTTDGHGAVGPGLAARQPADQRGRDPARRRRTTGTASDPADDSQFEHYYSTPRSRALENLLYGTPPSGHAGGALQPIDETGRTDLVAILLTGVPGLELHGHDAGRPAAPEHGDQAGRERRVPRRDGQRRRRRTGSACSPPTSAAIRTAAASATT